MEQPTIEPFMLTRFLVEAESTDLPLMNQTIIVVDTSGVAKSSLINVLRSNHPSSDALGKDNWFENRRVGKVSTRGRGKHTTRHVSLLSLSGVSYLADTPRFNRPNLLKVTRQSLAQAFPNVVDLYTVGDMGVQRAEPQLEPKRPKKHRRQSRKKINQSIVDELNDDDNLHLEIDPIVRATKNENQ
ncbi:hypothetical protein Goarm_023423 [Gossypium armourianum]|uniref:EngC GTPase domain-containing protein n=1 Tax=Gossypium armourianum TaxID=34283 RepID=A0A7J9KHG6_9ROSI|nr:hypothetical protein [Gossypium armourianum]